MNSGRYERRSLFICPRRPTWTIACKLRHWLQLCSNTADAGCAAESNETTCYYGTINQRATASAPLCLARRHTDYTAPPRRSPVICRFVDVGRRKQASAMCMLNSISFELPLTCCTTRCVQQAVNKYT